MNARAADPIAAWNAISETAVKTAGHPPPVAALDFAIVHLAIYDAVESIDRRYAPYYTFVPGATGSLSAAAAKAGHDVLVGLFPLQSPTLNAEYANFLETNGIDPLDPGTAVGALAAANMLSLRANDPHVCAGRGRARRCSDRLLGHQVLLRFLAADHGHPAGRSGRQSTHRRRSQLATAHRHT
jgi:hypothetical protein